MKTLFIILLSLLLLLAINNYPDDIAIIKDGIYYLGLWDNEIDTYAFKVGGGDFQDYFYISRKKLWEFVYDSRIGKTRRTECQRCGYSY